MRRRWPSRCAAPGAPWSSTRQQGFAGYGAEVAARLTEQCFYHLEAPVLRVTGLDIPYPPPYLEHLHLPNVDRILDCHRPPGVG